MATKLRLELNHDGIKELLLSDPIAAECVKAAEAIASRAGKGFAVRGPIALGQAGRAGVIVVTETYEAKLAEAEYGALSKAVR